MKTSLTCLILAFLTTMVQGDSAEECPGQQTQTSDPLAISLLPQAGYSGGRGQTIWFKPHEVSKNQVINLDFGREDSPGNFQPSLKLLLKTGNAKNLNYVLQKIPGSEKYINGRIPITWLATQNWSTFSLTNSTASLKLVSKEQSVEIRLDGLELDYVTDARIDSNKDITVTTECKVEEDSEITTKATTLAVEILTTTTPATTTPADTTITVPATTPNEENSTEISTLEEAEVTTDVSGEPNVNATQDSSVDVIPVAVIDGSGQEDCSRVPVWIWACMGIMAALIVLTVVLLVYVIILKRRNRGLMGFPSNQGDYIRCNKSSHKSTPGGYGQQARDLEFFQTGHQNVLAVSSHPSSAAYTQTLRLPTTDNQHLTDVRFSTAPRFTDYRRSTSCPGPRDRSPTISFPAPPSTPPPEARPETVPLYSPNGADDGDRRPCSRRHSKKSSSSRKRSQHKEYMDADDESSLSN